MYERLSMELHKLGALPVVNHVLDALKLDALLATHVRATDRRSRLEPGVALGVLLRNIILARGPIYGVQEWARPYDPGLLGLRAPDVALLQDDRVGRALDRLFDADRATMQTTLAVRAVRAFGIALDQLHNDSTSVTFSGEYAQATGRIVRGKRALRITRGHNKDHRPDLKQILWILTVSADGAVPIHFRSCDGNTNDDPTHIETWETLRKIAGRSDFLYVADSKLCSRENMGHIAARGGRFLTVMPRSRKEDAWFRAYARANDVGWEDVIRRDHPRRGSGPKDVWRVVESPLRSAEGYRIIWVWSTALAEHEGAMRARALRKAVAALEELRETLSGPRCRFRAAPGVQSAVESVLTTHRVARWIETTVETYANVSYTQERRGRPGPNTRYRKNERTRFRLSWHLREDLVAADAATDGMYPLMTNREADSLTAADALRAYKQQPRLEKRHEQLKSVHLVAPVFLKNETRIEALLFLYFVAMLVHALIERQVRSAMRAAGLEALPLYPEKRKCRAPTASRILELLDDAREQRLLERGTIVKRSAPNLSDLQRQILSLLGLTPRFYGRG